MSIQPLAPLVPPRASLESPYAGPAPATTVPAGGWRVLHTLSGRDWSAAEKRVVEQVRWLIEHGHAAWLAAPPDGEAYRRAEAQGLPVLAMAFERPWRPSVLGPLRRIISDNRVELIDAHGGRDAKAAIACLSLCAVVRSRHSSQPLRSSLLGRLNWRRGCDHVITMDGDTRHHLLNIGLAVPLRSTAISGSAEDSMEQTLAAYWTARRHARRRIFPSVF